MPQVVRSLVIFACIGTLVVGAFAGRTLVAGSAGFGSEQALIALLPYRLPAAAAPAGYLQQDEVASTNAAIAFGAAGTDRNATLERLVDGGRITGLQQTFTPAAGSADPPVDILIGLYANAGASAAAVAVTAAPGVSRPAENLTAPALGDGARALKSEADEDGSSVFLITWSRGPLFFAVSLRGTDSIPDSGTAFAQALDANAAAAGAFGPVAPYRQPDERTELNWGSALDAAQLPAAAVPARLIRSGAYLWSNEQVVLDSRQPASSAERLSGDQQRITGEVEYFTDDRSRVVLSSVYTVFVDAAGAQGAVREDPLVSGVRQAVVPLSAPVQLGEEMVAFESVLRWPLGELRESYTLQWRHGALLLAIIVNQPAGQPVPSFLGDVATALEQAYAASVLAQSHRAAA
jgi:hypothetical protein